MYSYRYDHPCGHSAITVMSGGNCILSSLLYQTKTPLPVAALSAHNIILRVACFRVKPDFTRFLHPEQVSGESG